MGPSPPPSHSPLLLARVSVGPPSFVGDSPAISRGRHGQSLHAETRPRALPDAPRPPHCARLQVRRRRRKGLIRGARFRGALGRPDCSESKGGSLGWVPALEAWSASRRGQRALQTGGAPGGEAGGGGSSRLPTCAGRFLPPRGVKAGVRGGSDSQPATSSQEAAHYPASLKSN